MKRIFNLLVLSLLVLIFISSAALAQTLNVWNVSPISSDPGTKVIGDLFEEKNPGAEVKFTGIPYSDKLTKSSTEFFAGAKNTSFDVDEITEMWLPIFVENEWLDPITDYADSSFLNQYPEALLNALKFNGKIYAIPHYINQPLFYYNKKLLKEAGYDRPPKTWEELKEYSRKLTKDGQFGFAVPLYQESDTLYYFLTYIYEAGGRMYNENGDIAFNSKATLKALDFLVDMYQEGLMPKGVNTMDCFRVANLFRQKKVAMMINWAFEIGTCLKEDSPIKDDFAVTSQPAGPAGQQICAAPWLYVLSSRAKEKSLAVDYLKNWMDPELLPYYVITEPGKIVPIVDVYNVEKVKENLPFVEVIRDNINNFILEVGPKKEEIGMILVKSLNMALIGEKSTQEALNFAEKQAKELLK